MFKKLLKILWRLTSPIRRPFGKKLEGWLNETILIRLDHANQRLEVLSHDVNLALNSQVREIARLQMQLEVLQQRLEESRLGADSDPIADASGHGFQPLGFSPPPSSKAS